VVRVEVSDRDPLRLHGAPGRVCEPEARVEERPAREIAVNVLRAGRQGEGEPPNAIFELYERLFYTPLCRHGDRVSRRALQERPESR